MTTQTNTTYLSSEEITELAEMTGASFEVVLKVTKQVEAGWNFDVEPDYAMVTDRIVEDVTYEISMGRGQ
jgi:hypothetical protein